MTVEELIAECLRRRHTTYGFHLEEAAKALTAQAEEIRTLRAERDALRVALQVVIAEADRNTDAFIRARALLLSDDEP